ncbi:MarR family transcriptional regulator [Streptomyces sp. NBC_00190]|uniref:MarR family winged helix-turn-helix transcriptional regulator n=1 Tax=unclassified Streptomyces TaxID=2593676 RepID=UPI002E2D13DA|nr:MarR family transcriptional regulator [Streptomyces sp. NBC_00190]WSZ39860.1 MarR family transcriptional regulator [Streptomyces sp. NBC_00868]
MGEEVDARRAEVLEELGRTGRETSAATVVFHEAAAAKQGLSATETKTLDLLQRRGPLTAKELSQLSGLAPASVTGLVDRLERKGFVRRAEHPTDKRRVLVEALPERLDAIRPVFDDWAREVAELCAEFTTEELETVIRFLQGSNARQLRAAARLSDS